MHYIHLCIDRRASSKQDYLVATRRFCDCIFSVYKTAVVVFYGPGLLLETIQLQWRVC